MKVCVATEDGKTVSRHFGMAAYYLVYDIEGGTIKEKETRPKANHGMGMMEHHGHSEGSLHRDMISNVRDCEAVVAGGMGAPMHEYIAHSGLKPCLTSIEDADAAALAYANGKLHDQKELLHFH